MTLKVNDFVDNVHVMTVTLNMQKYNQDDSQHIFTIMQHDIPIIVLKKPVKNIILRIDRHGVVKVSAPLRCSLKRVREWITEKEGWINKHLTRIKAQSLLSCAPVQTGDLCPYLGQQYPLQRYEGHQRPSISFKDHHIVCFIKPNATANEIGRLFQHWYRSEMKAILPDLIIKWERIIGVKVNEWGIKSMKTRWGSCNTIRKRIWLNLNLMQKPLICLEYVLVHEMVHLLEPSHNKRFYGLMSSFMPAWQDYKRLLLF